MVAWFFYAMWGLISALIQGEKFDPYKFGRSVVWAIIVVVLSLLTGLSPQVVLSQEANFIEQALAFIMNSGAGIALIWFIDRLYGFIMGIRTRIATWFAAEPAPAT